MIIIKQPIFPPQGPFVDYEWHYSCLDDELLPDTPGNLVWRAYNMADQKQLEEAYQNDDSTFVLIPSARPQDIAASTLISAI